MDRAGLEDLRDHVTHLLEELEEIRQHIVADLQNPSDQVYDTYDDIEDDLEQAADRALNDQR